MKLSNLLLILLAFAPLATKAQTPQSISNESQPQVYQGEYRLPLFRAKWEFQTYCKWVISQIIYPADCVDEGVEGRVVVAFIIDKDGVVRNAMAQSSPDPRLSQELVRVLKSGKWSVPPGRWNNEKQRYLPVGMRCVIPITFTIPEDLNSKESNISLTYGMMESGFSNL